MRMTRIILAYMQIIRIISINSRIRIMLPNEVRHMLDLQIKIFLTRFCIKMQNSSQTALENSRAGLTQPHLLCLLNKIIFQIFTSSIFKYAIAIFTLH